MLRVVALAVSLALVVQAAAPCGHACHTTALDAVASATVAALPTSAPPSQHACHKSSTEADRVEAQPVPCSHDQGVEDAILNAGLSVPDGAKVAPMPAVANLPVSAAHVADAIGAAHVPGRALIASPSTCLSLQLRI